MLSLAVLFYYNEKGNTIVKLKIELHTKTYCTLKSDPTSIGLEP